MGCVGADGVVICSPSAWSMRRRVMECPTEGRRRRMVEIGYGWYGPTHMCCGCGDTWEDGWRTPRPFARGWKARAIAKHRRIWREMEPFDNTEAELAAYRAL